MHPCMHAAACAECRRCYGGYQVDPRLPAEAQERVKQRMAAMVHRTHFDGPTVSRVLARAYHDVTRRRILCCPE